VVPHDSPDYFNAGYRLIWDGDFPLPLKRPPLYPVFLAGAVGLVGSNLQVIALLQHLLGMVVVVLVYWLGRLAIGRGTGLLAAALTAINGSLLLMEHSLMSEVLFTALLLAALLSLLIGLRGRGTATFLVVGLLLGLAALTRPAAQAILPLAIAAVVLTPLRWQPRLLATSLVRLATARPCCPGCCASRRRMAR
jgi:4-amino-4-deoxy-L-arabinose transferase-like glycosyltransferase